MAATIVRICQLKSGRLGPEDGYVMWTKLYQVDCCVYYYVTFQSLRDCRCPH